MTALSIPHFSMVRALPTIHINGMTYFIDERLYELRSEVDPHKALWFPSGDMLRAFIERVSQPHVPRPPTPQEPP